MEVPLVILVMVILVLFCSRDSFRILFYNGFVADLSRIEEKSSLETGFFFCFSLALLPPNIFGDFEARNFFLKAVRFLSILKIINKHIPYIAIERLDFIIVRMWDIELFQVEGNNNLNKKITGTLFSWLFTSFDGFLAFTIGKLKATCSYFRSFTCSYFR